MNEPWHVEILLFPNYLVATQKRSVSLNLVQRSRVTITFILSFIFMLKFNTLTYFEISSIFNRSRENKTVAFVIV